MTINVREGLLLPSRADRGYDSDAIREDAWFHGTDPVVLTKHNPKLQCPVDPLLYRSAQPHRAVLRTTASIRGFETAGATSPFFVDKLDAVIAMTGLQ